MTQGLDPKLVSNLLMQTTPPSPSKNSFVYKQYPYIWDYMSESPNAQAVPNPRFVPKMLPEAGTWMDSRGIGYDPLKR